MKYIYVAEHEKETLVLKDKITQEELDYLNSAFFICGIYHSITQIKNVVIENGQDFQHYMNPTNLQTLRNNNTTPERLILLANKQVLNYASSIKTYIDMELRLLTKYKTKTEITLFNDLCHKFYDNHMEYRFWMNFRNYIVHCDFPYAVFHEEINMPCKVICTKDHLLQFNNWKHSKNDILKMGNEIDLPKMVNNMSSLILALYIDFFSYFGTQIMDGIKIYGEFCRKHNVNSPYIIKLDNPKDLSGANMQPLPVPDLDAAFKVLQSNPHVTINIT